MDKEYWNLLKVIRLIGLDQDNSSVLISLANNIDIINWILMEVELKLGYVSLCKTVLSK